MKKLEKINSEFVRIYNENKTYPNRKIMFIVKGGTIAEYNAFVDKIAKQDKKEDKVKMQNLASGASRKYIQLVKNKLIIPSNGKRHDDIKKLYPNLIPLNKRTKKEKKKIQKLSKKAIKRKPIEARKNKSEAKTIATQLFMAIDFYTELQAKKIAKTDKDKAEVLSKAGVITMKLLSLALQKDEKNVSLGAIREILNRTEGKQKEMDLHITNNTQINITPEAVKDTRNMIENFINVDDE